MAALLACNHVESLGHPCLDGRLPVSDRGELAEIERSCTELLEAGTGLRAASLSRRGQVRYRLGRIAEAIADYSAAVDLDPRNGRLLVRRGYALLVGDPEAAEMDFSRALVLDSNDVLALDGLGSVAWHRGDVSRASRFYQEALAINPGRVRIRFNLAELYRARGVPQIALEHYRRIIENYPDVLAEDDLSWRNDRPTDLLLESLVRRVELLLPLRTSEARADLDRLDRLYPGSAGALLARARLELNEHDARRGAELAAQSARLEPNRAETWRFLILAYTILRDRHGQFRAYENYFALAPQDTSLLLGFAFALKGAGYTDRSRDVFLRAFALHRSSVVGFQERAAYRGHYVGRPDGEVNEPTLRAMELCLADPHC